MSLELTGVHGLLKRHKLFTHKYYEKEIFKVYCMCSDHGNVIVCYRLRWFR